MLRFRYPDKPIETTPEVVQRMNDADWIAQSKYDGWRLQAYVRGPANVECLTSAGKSMQAATSKFDKEFVLGLQALNLPPETVLDMEFVGPRGDLSPNIYLFDILAWNGLWLTNEPCHARWTRCVELAPQLPDRIHLATTVHTGFLDLFNELKGDWHHQGRGMSLTEGIVVKHRKGMLNLDLNRCKKSDCMFKLKFREIRSERF